MAEIFVDGLYDAVLDCLKVIPILFLAYLLVSYLSHDHSHKFSKFLAKSKKTSVLYASFLGCVPQCGFSSVIADLYSKNHVSLGTLIAVFVATSDEAIPIMLANTNVDNFLKMLLLIGVKIAFALFWGYVIDLIVDLFRAKKKQKKSRTKENEIAIQTAIESGVGRQKSNSCETHQHEEHHHNHPECGHIHTQTCDEKCGHSHGDCCVNNVFLDAFIHTFNIVIYIFVATFVINLIVGFFGTTALENLLTTNMYLQVLIASLIGLIPNCASSVLLVELNMLYGTLTFPALIAGLTSGAGVGLFILCSKNRKHPIQNFGILLLQYLIGVSSGMFLTIFF